VTRALLFDTLNMTPRHSGGVGAVASELLLAYIEVARERNIKFGFLDNWDGERAWCANFDQYRYFYDLPFEYDEVVYHLVSAFRCGFRNSRSDIDRFRGRKVIATHHDFIDLDYPWLFDLRELTLRKDAYRSFTRYDGVVVPSKIVADRLVTEFGTPRSKIGVIAHGNDQHLGLAVAEPEEAQGRFILFVGKLYPHKNWERLLAACAAARDDFLRAETKLLFITSDYTAKREILEQLHQSLNLAGIVDFQGFLPQQELAALFLTASGFVCPSLIEGFGMPVFEAEAFGLPLCVSDIPMFRELLAISDRPATLFDPRSVESMAKALREFLNAMGGERAPPFVRSWKTVALEYMDFMDDVLTSPGSDR
jgi:glycosyltransferase involved in cell wall biosynthesis